MSEPTDRAAQFSAEIAEMKLKTARPNLESRLVIAGIVLMVAGVVLGLIAYAASQNVTATPGSNVDMLDSNSYIALAIAGGAITIAGGFVFLRYSLAKFLRFWLLRQIYEQRVALDRASRDD